MKIVYLVIGALVMFVLGIAGSYVYLNFISPDREQLFTSAQIPGASEQLSLAGQITGAQINQSSAPNTIVNLNLQLRNDGTLVWDPADITLRPCVDGMETVFPISESQILSSQVNSGQTANIALRLNAPDQPGYYFLCYQIEHKELGVFTKNGVNRVIEVRESNANILNSAEIVQIQVGNNLLTQSPNSASQSSSPAMRAASQLSNGSRPVIELNRNVEIPVRAQIRNTGNTNWQSKTGFQLINKDDNWGIAEVKLPPAQVIEPGQILELEFNIVTPSEVGNYDFHWQMQQLGVNNFGQISQFQLKIIDN